MVINWKIPFTPSYINSRFPKSWSPHWSAKYPSYEGSHLCDWSKSHDNILSLTNFSDPSTWSLGNQNFACSVHTTDTTLFEEQSSLTYLLSSHCMNSLEYQWINASFSFLLKYRPTWYPRRRCHHYLEHLLREVPPAQFEEPTAGPMVSYFSSLLEFYIQFLLWTIGDW